MASKGKRAWILENEQRILRKMSQQPSAAAVRRCAEREILTMRRKYGDDVPESAWKTFEYGMRLVADEFIVAHGL